jgi:hypothetical protein
VLEVETSWLRRLMQAAGATGLAVLLERLVAYLLN